MNRSALQELLTDLGELLAARGHRYEVAVLGGTALLLRDVVHRTTRDVDVVGVWEAGQWVAVDVLPHALAAAVVDVARLHEEDPEWLNARASGLLRVGLPDAWISRVTPVDYGDGLRVVILGRLDLIHTKLYALTDQSPTSKHATDLIALQPSDAELEQAAAWCRVHDPSPAFADQLQQVLRWLRARER